MKVVKTVKKRAGKGQKGQKSSTFNPILLPFTLIYNVLSFFWSFLFSFPTSPQYILGFIRVVIWGSLFWFPDYKELSNIYFADYSNSIRLLWPWLLPLFTFFMTAYSLAIMFGLNSNTTLPDESTELPNFDATMRILDGRLSSPGNRSKVLKKFFD